MRFWSPNRISQVYKALLKGETTTISIYCLLNVLLRVKAWFNPLKESFTSKNSVPCFKFYL